MSEENQAVDEREARVIGEFDSFDAVRAFVEEDDEEKKRGIIAGDLAIINGNICRVMKDGTFATVVDVVAEYGVPSDHTEAFERGLTDIERIVLSSAFETGSLLATFTSVLIAMFKGRPKQWSQMSEGEQRDMKRQLENHGKDLIRKITRVVAEGEDISVAGKLESYTHKGSFDLKVSAAADAEAAVELFKMQGHDIIIMSADSKRFLDTDADADIDPDEMPLPFADGPGSFDEDAEEGDEVEEAPVGDDALDSAAEEVVEEQQAAGDGKPIGADFEASEAKRLAEAKAADDANRAPAPKADTDEDKGGVEAAPETVEEPENQPLEGGVETAAEADSGQAPGEYEGRRNPDDEFEEATEEELAQQKARAQGDTSQSADYVGPREPERAVPGESWIDTSASDQRPKFKHPNNHWYLKKPSEDDLAKWRAENEKPADESGFPPAVE